MNPEHEHRSRSPCVPKLVGADDEMGNFRRGVSRGHGSGPEASRALLREVDGVRGSADGPMAMHETARDDPQDIGRKYLASNGGCVYIDLDHLELCTPEVISAFDFVAAWHGMLRVARDAQRAANARRAPEEAIVVLVNCSDGHGNSYGSHINFLVSRRLWDDLFRRRLHPGLFVLAAHQVSSIVYTGQGKVGAENGRPEVAYQLSQRADFFDQLLGPQTTYNRPLVNARDESLCGHATGLARLHCIFHDSTLCHVSTLLKVGVMQMVLSMLEAGRLDGTLMLEDPLLALLAYSHDPGLSARARLVDGRAVTAVELQSMLCEQARAHADAGGFNGLVPEAPAIIEFWEDTLCKLERRDFDALAPRLDWVLKLTQIDRALACRGLDWTAPEAKHLDHVYSSLDADEGLYWALEKAELTQTLVDDARVERFRHSPPEDTRAWTRAMLLRRIARESIRRVDWDHMELAPSGGTPRHIPMPDPLGHTRAEWCAAMGIDPVQSAATPTTPMR